MLVELTYTNLNYCNLDRKCVIRFVNHQLGRGYAINSGVRRLSITFPIKQSVVMNRCFGRRKTGTKSVLVRKNRPMVNLFMRFP